MFSVETGAERGAVCSFAIVEILALRSTEDLLVTTWLREIPAGKTTDAAVDEM